MKTCSKCGVEKPLTDFPTRARNKDGRRAACLECYAPVFGMTTKVCSKCVVEKSLTDFHKDAGTVGGRCCWCKTCQAVANRARLLKNPDKHRAIVKRAGLKSAYGITPEGKDALIAGQKGCCSCCGDPFSSARNAHVDHIHGSDPIVIRGILCPQCNCGLGNFKDSPERLLKAVAYLKKFQK